jgi:hypothetical protein
MKITTVAQALIICFLALGFEQTINAFQPRILIVDNAFKQGLVHEQGLQDLAHRLHAQGTACSFLSIANVSMKKNVSPDYLADQTVIAADNNHYQMEGKLYKAMFAICAQKQINVIICSQGDHVQAARKVQMDHPIRIIFADCGKIKSPRRGFLDPYEGVDGVIRLSADLEKPSYVMHNNVKYWQTPDAFLQFLKELNHDAPQKTDLSVQPSELIVNSFAEYLKDYIPPTQKPIVVVVPSFNNSAWYKRNLDSVYAQNYQNYRIIYLDDCSTDGTGDAVQQYVQSCNQAHRTTVIKRTTKYRGLANIYCTVQDMIQDDAIVIQLDGDDWFEHNEVFSLINKLYNRYDIWMTYGNNKAYPDGRIEPMGRLPSSIVENNMLRTGVWFYPAHLRTFYAWLCKRVKQEDLMINGWFFEEAGDLALMFPMFEMARKHMLHVPDVLYVWNRATPINAYKVHRNSQKSCQEIVKAKKPYQELFFDMVGNFLA